jgi:hypothetical protein
MPHTKTWEQNGLLRKFSGKINPEEILKSNFEIHVHPEFEKIAYIINDFTEVSDLSINVSHTKIYASTDDIISNTKGKLNIAFIVNQDTHLNLANSYRNQMKNKFFKCEIFKTIDDARKWVGS